MTCVRLTLVCALWTAVCFGQNAQISGLIRDPSTLTVSGADIRILNEQVNRRQAETRDRMSRASTAFPLWLPVITGLRSARLVLKRWCGKESSLTWEIMPGLISI